MKLNFTESEKKSIIDVITSYERINKTLDEYQRKSKEIEKNIDENIKKIDKIRKKEKEILHNLKLKYGNFTLQDISDTIYG